jgi:hypothetical protein
MATGRLRMWIASTMVVAFVWMVSAPLAQAQGLASWSGRVFETDRRTPQAGAVVSLRDGGGDRTFRSEPTRADGAFVIDGAPPGSYELAIETPAGTYVSGEPVQLQSGPNKAMALGLTSSAPYNAKQEGGFGKSGSRRTEYIVGGIVSLLALLLILELSSDSDEQRASVS